MLFDLLNFINEYGESKSSRIDSHAAVLKVKNAFLHCLHKLLKKLEEVKRTKQSICFQKFICVVDFASLSCGNILVKISNAPDKCLYNTVPSSNYFDRDND